MSETLFLSHLQFITDTMSTFTGKIMRAIGADKLGDGRVKLVTLRELPKSLYATQVAVTAYPGTSRGRKATFSHIEVFKMVENVANKLRESGVRPGTVCAMALHNTFEAIVYFFALQWIGAVAAPLGPDMTEEKLALALSAVKAQTLCTPYVDPSDARDDVLFQAAESASSRLGLLNWHVYRTINEGVQLETNSQLMGSAAWAGGAGDFKLDPEEISVHLTSGAEVVPLSHRALTAAARSFVATYDIDLNMTTVLDPPLYDIHGILVLISVFYSGGHLVLPGTVQFDADRFWDLAKTHNVTWASSSPEHILEMYESRSANSAILHPLSFVRCSGGPMSSDVLSRVQESFNAPILESYGTPEVSGFATSNRQMEMKPGTYGRPVDGAHVAIFHSESREMLPPGSSEEGEIAVTGDQIAGGYLNSAEATRMALYETEDDSGRRVWFATGDRGMIDLDGYLTVIGDSRELRAAERAAREQEANARRLREDEERAAAAAAASASAAAAAAASAELHDRNAALARAGVDDPSDLDDETADAILSRLAIIERNQNKLARELADKNAAELEDLRVRLADAEAAADRASRGNHMFEGDEGPAVLDVRMDELESAVRAAASSAEASARNTREALQAAKDVAESAYGTNQSRAVALTSPTGDQGALTKTVRVALDDVENAMRNHPAVEHARAFGRKDRRFGAEVFCAIVPKRGARVSEPWLKLHAESVLPAPMVPKKFYYLNELPVGLSRRDLSDSPLLRDLSEFSGYTDVKSSHIRGPTWRTKEPAVGGSDRPPRSMYA